MSSTPWIPTVATVQDGQNVDQTTVNAVFNQLIQRDQYLFERFDDLDNKSVLIASRQPVHPDDVGDVAVDMAVYFKYDINGSGLAPALANFDSSLANQLYAPANSCFIMGIVKSLETAGGVVYADLYINGMISIPLVNLLETGATLATGPYFLSRKEAGKITQAPGGVAVYVGYANNTTDFLLNPNVEEFSEFYINYRFGLLDRPNGTPIKTITTWSVTAPDVTPHAPPGAIGAINRVGWINVADIPINIVPPASVPAGAKFFYGLPAELLTDDSTAYAALDNPGISIDEKTDSKLLLLALPPQPIDLSFLFVNGICQTLRSLTNPTGIYSVDGFGLWWYNDQDGYQPWASDLPPTWVPADWPSNKGSESLRPHLLYQFIKFNPAVRAAIVSSLTSFSDSTNDSSNVLKFFHQDTGLESSIGDLLAKFNLPISTATEATLTNTFVKSFTYNQVAGQLEVKTSPGITGIAAGNGINVSVSGAGAATISSTSLGVSGAVDSLEPENARLEYMGLHSYLNLVDSATLPTGVVGKLLLPSSLAVGDLSLVLFMFGKTSTGSQKAVNFNFEYAVATPKDLAGTNINLNYTINSTVTAGANPISINLPAAVYTGYQMFYVTPATMIIPAAKLRGDMWVNFRLSRTTSTYTGDVGLVGVYWTIEV